MQEDTSDTPPQLFDSIFKVLMHLSSPTLINFINGLFGTAYSLDSTIESLETESINESLKRWISDKRLLINHQDKYLMEVQMTDDEEMALRIFNYDYLEAVKTKTIEGNRVSLDFSRVMVIYLEPTSRTPRELIASLKFPDKTVHEFKAPCLRFLDYSIAELEEKRLTLLLPFYLLKLRKRIKGAGSGKQLEELSAELKGLIKELMETIERSRGKGLMSEADIRKVIVLTGKLYNGLYKKYKEFEEVNGMVADMLLAELDEAEMAGEARGEARGKEIGKEIRAKEFAHYLIREGWNTEKIAEATQLDLPTVESLYRSGGS